MAAKTPTGLASGGRSLWREITTDHPDLDAAQRVQLEEACRAKDRCDKLDLLLRGDVKAWATIILPSEDDLVLKIDGALASANATANLLKQLLAAIRLPDEATGKRPQVRSARGAYKPTATGRVSSLDRARAARSA